MPLTSDIVPALSGAVVSLITAAGTVWVARSGRRTERQENRDDFATFTTGLHAELTRMKDEMAAQKGEMVEQRKRINDQDIALTWLTARLRTLVTYIRKSGLEPPPAAPVPERVQ